MGRIHGMSRRPASYRPCFEVLEARDLMTAGGKITGIVFNDAITNGRKDASELPLAGVTVFADSNANGILEAGEASTKTGLDGTYTLAVGQDGKFQPRQLEPQGFALTTAEPAPVSLTGVEIVGNVNFGDRRTLPPNQSYVDQTFRDLLGRGADAGALAFFGGALDQGSLEHTQVGQFVESSTEFHSRQIDQSFKELLHRSADPAGNQAFLGLFAKGTTIEQADAAILASPEYFQKRGGGSNAGYATALFQDVLGRSIDSAGLQFAQNFLASGGSRLLLTQVLQSSPESDAHEVQQLYQRFLRRDPDAGGLAAFAADLHRGASDEQIAAAIASSDEYFQRFCL